RERKPGDKGNASNQRHAKHHVTTCPSLSCPVRSRRGGRPAGWASGRTLRRGRRRRWRHPLGTVVVVGVPWWLCGPDCRQGCGGVVGGAPHGWLGAGCWSGGWWGGLLCLVGSVLRGWLWGEGCRRWGCGGVVVGAPQRLFGPGCWSGGWWWLLS